MFWPFLVKWSQPVMQKLDESGRILVCVGVREWVHCKTFWNKSTWWAPSIIQGVIVADSTHFVSGEFGLPVFWYMIINRSTHPGVKLALESSANKNSRNIYGHEAVIDSRIISWFVKAVQAEWRYIVTQGKRALIRDKLYLGDSMASNNRTLVRITQPTF